jgi:hypothetical protein
MLSIVITRKRAVQLSVFNKELIPPPFPDGAFTGYIHQSSLLLTCGFILLRFCSVSL